MVAGMRVCCWGVSLLTFACFAARAAERQHHDAAAPAVTDFRGREIVPAREVRRIVCLIESALAGLYMLNVEDRVVAVPAVVYKGDVAPQYAAMDPRIRDNALPVPGNWDFVNLESVVALKPDLVIIWAQQKESIASMEAAGLPVYGVELNSFEDIYKEILDFGRLTAATDRAEELVRYTRDELKAFAQRLGGIAGDPVPAYFMWAQGPLETAGLKSTANDLLARAGARNICRSPSEHVVVNIETVLTANPEIIVMWHNERLDPDDVWAMPGWRALAAAKSKRIHELPSAFFCDFWTLKFQYAVKMVATWCHPGVFTDVNMAQEKRGMMEALYGPKGLECLK